MAASVVSPPDDVEPAEDQEQPPACDHPPPTTTDDDADEPDDDSPPAASADLPFPLFAPKAFYLLDQTTAPRRWCLQLIASPYPLRQLGYTVCR